LAVFVSAKTSREGQGQHQRQRLGQGRRSSLRMITEGHHISAKVVVTSLQ